MQSLCEKSLETRDNSLNASDDIFNRSINGVVWHERIFERYHDGSLSFHVHAAIRKAGVRRAVCWECFSRNGDAGVGNIPDGKDGEPVLISVCEVMKNPERLSVREDSSGAVRLHTLDFINGRCGNAVPRKTIVNRPLTLNEPIIDGEVGLIFSNNERAWRISGRERPGNVVQSMAGIIDAVPKDGADMRVRMTLDIKLRMPSGAVFFDGHNAVGIEFWRILFDVFDDFELERFQVLICPDDFEPCSV